MARTEPKLRPSIAVSDMLLLSKVLESEIVRRIQEGNKGIETLQVAKLKEYVDSFKPTVSVTPDLLAKYMQPASGVGETSALVQALESVNATNSTEYVSCLNDSALTDEQKYDLLLLQPESKYSPEEVEFINLKGFAIKMARMTKANVNEGDL